MTKIEETVERVTKGLIFNGPATIIPWDDGTKTVVKVSKDDIFDPVKGYLIAVFERAFSLSKREASKVLRRVKEIYAEQQA